MQESPRMPQENFEKHAVELARFRAEIAALKAQERETLHLRDIQPEELTEEDAYVYQLFMDNTLDPNMFEIYRNSIQKKGSRVDFAAYLTNKILVKQLDAYLAKDPKPKKG